MAHWKALRALSFQPLTFKKFQKMIEKKIIETLTRCYYDEFSGSPDENIEHDEKMELRSPDEKFDTPQNKERHSILN